MMCLIFDMKLYHFDVIIATCSKSRKVYKPLNIIKLWDWTDKDEDSNVVLFLLQAAF